MSLVVALAVTLATSVFSAPISALTKRKRCLPSTNDADRKWSLLQFGWHANNRIPQQDIETPVQLQKKAHCFQKEPHTRQPVIQKFDLMY